MKTKFLNLKEFVLTVVLSCLMIGIGYVIMLPFAANMQLLYFLEPGLIGLVNGIIYVLIIRKCAKIGTQFIIAALYGTYMLIMGSATAALYFYILAVINELIMLGSGYQSKIRPAVPHVLMWCLNAMGSTFNLFLFRQSYVQIYMDAGMDEAAARAAVDQTAQFWCAPQNILISLVVTAVLCVGGYLLGVKMLGKHFKPAGVA
ncbi:MptD family putative ECF transporter S component [Diplocloster modestus]|uniref:MptD family putative ECF transporter S component n=1 Tax=Diplocloster modestus TaxID=2850322 RepID=A0ABS6K7V5_9FIRM|nr:MptD family putative ECF transporter S component [Diplocloster modestus]MBU9726593.1 MptD family putative ECF transporter S component [Diplocloster modestus]